MTDYSVNFMYKGQTKQLSTFIIFFHFSVNQTQSWEMVICLEGLDTEVCVGVNVLIRWSTIAQSAQLQKWKKKKIESITPAL